MEIQEVFQWVSSLNPMDVVRALIVIVLVWGALSVGKQIAKVLLILVAVALLISYFL